MSTPRAQLRMQPAPSLLGWSLVLAMAMVGCRGGGPPPRSPAEGLPGLEALGFMAAASDFAHGFIADSALDGDIAFLAARRGFAVVDLSTPSAPEILAVIPTSPALPLNDVVVSDGLAWVTAGERDDGEPGALIIFDVSDPRAPFERSRLEVEDAAIGVTVIDGLAYLGAWSEGFIIVDVHDPDAPRRLSTWRLPDPDSHTITRGTAHVWWPAVRPPLAWVTYDGAGLFVLDVSEPTAPALVGSFDRPTTNGGADCFFNEIALDGDLAYVAVDYCGLLILDVSDPRAIQERTLLDLWSGARWQTTPGHAVQIELEGDRLFLTTSRDGLYVFDVTDRTAPRLTHARPASHAAGRGCAWGMTLTSELLLLDYTLCLPTAGITGGLEVFERR